LLASPLFPTPHSRSADAHGGSLLPASAQTDSRKVEADRLLQQALQQSLLLLTTNGMFGAVEFLPKFHQD
jgi:hypothetical protein